MHIFKIISLVLFLGVAILAGFLHASANNSDNLSQYAWSETTGWISFNNTNCDTDDNGTSNGGTGCPPAGTSMGKYGVTVANNGDISGYAWAENIGWIQFYTSGNGCPSNPCKASMNKNNGTITGWAHACAGTVNGDCTGADRSDGWDGWIHLSGTAADGSSYGIAANSCQWNGYAWGSNNIGWIHFQGVAQNGSLYGVQGKNGSDACARILPQCSDGVDNDNDGKIDYPADPGCSSANDNSERGVITFTASPTLVFPGSSSTLAWTTDSLVSCSIDQGIGAVAVNGSRSVIPANNTTYTLTCNAGPETATVSVTVGKTPAFKEVKPQ